MKQEKTRESFKQKIFIISIIIIVVILIFDITPFGGTLKFYSKWIACGEKPVVTRGSGYLNSNAQSYTTPPSLNIFPGDQLYYCTPLEAEKAGYSANANFYDFPHLRKQ